MLFHYQEHSLKPGIYKILNTHTNRVYIGQASRFKTRWYGHVSSLTTRKNANQFLQNDFNKCREALGHDDFLEFHVLEVMEGSTKEKRNRREEWWIAQFWDNQDKCYNFKRQANAKSRSKTTKWQKQMSNAAKLKIGLAHKQLVTQHPEVLLPPQEGRAIWARNNPERLKEITSQAGKASALKRALTITLLDPKDQEVTITNIAQYAKTHNLQPEGLMAVWNGKKDSYKGWLRVGDKREAVQKRLAERHADSCSDSWRFVNPEGAIAVIRNLRQFCRINGLSQGNMQMVAMGKRKHHKGWTKPI